MGSSSMKRRWVLMSLVSVTFLCGCAHHQYLVQLTNGAQVVAVTKPELKNGNYHFTDDSGQNDMVPKSRVVKIRAVSIVEENKPSPTPTGPKKSKHWYFLWLM